MGQTGTKLKNTKIPQWLEEEAKETRLPLLTDVTKSGKELGRGQSSVVEEVVYNGEVCAMKVPASSHKKYTLLEEAKMLATLKHPHILKIIEVTVIGCDEQMSAVFEKCATTLRHFLNSLQKEMVPLSLKLQILQATSGIALLKQCNTYIHRNLPLSMVTSATQIST